MFRTLTTAAGIILLAFGLLFLLQGLDIVHWPADSFMLGRQTWVLRGGVIAAIGAVLIVAGQWRRARPQP